MISLMSFGIMFELIKKIGQDNKLEYSVIFSKNVEFILNVKVTREGEGEGEVEVRRRTNCR